MHVFVSFLMQTLAGKMLETETKVLLPGPNIVDTIDFFFFFLKYVVFYILGNTQEFCIVELSLGTWVDQYLRKGEGFSPFHVPCESE